MLHVPPAGGGRATVTATLRERVLEHAAAHPGEHVAQIARCIRGNSSTVAREAHALARAGLLLLVREPRRLGARDYDVLVARPARDGPVRDARGLPAGMRARLAHHALQRLGGRATLPEVARASGLTLAQVAAALARDPRVLARARYVTEYALTASGSVMA